MELDGVGVRVGSVIVGRTVTRGAVRSPSGIRVNCAPGVGWI